MKIAFTSLFLCSLISMSAFASEDVVTADAEAQELVCRTRHFNCKEKCSTGSDSHCNSVCDSQLDICLSKIDNEEMSDKELICHIAKFNCLSRLKENASQAEKLACETKFTACMSGSSAN